MKASRPSLIKTIVLLLFLPLALLAAKQVVDFRKSAVGTPANIVVDAKNIQGNIPSTLWQNLSQGGEQPLDMIKPIIPLLQQIKPQLIRIDHIFDYYKVDQGNGNYDFSRLDSAIDSILATGAKPMLSLSYTPDAKAPGDWNQWYQLVKATAHHYSVVKNISGIYYEVWNEPDLFGSWKYDRDPNYSTLYIQSSRAIANGAASTIYKVGGPATTAYYRNWIKALFKTASDNHLRLDFISWHKYTKNLDTFQQDFDDMNQILTSYPQYFNLERLITEVGPNSESDSWYDNPLSGIHLISLSTRMAGKIHRLFTFEAIDGPTPRSDISSGWGIITHDLKTKPRYFAIQFLNLLQGQRLNSSGDGSWVTSLASLNNKTIQILLVNYDPNNLHTETFPISVQNLTPGKYTITTIRFLNTSTQKMVNINNTYQDTIYLDPNSAIIIEVTPSY